MGVYYRAIFFQPNGEPTAYADPTDFGTAGNIENHSWVGNPFMVEVEQMLTESPKRILWAGGCDMPEDGQSENLYDLSDSCERLMPTGKSSPVRYLVNIDKGEYVDMTKASNYEGCFVHPLPHLTASDGRWKKDTIAAVCDLSQIPTEFKEISARY